MSRDMLITLAPPLTVAEASARANMTGAESAHITGHIDVTDGLGSFWSAWGIVSPRGDVQG